MRESLAEALLAVAMAAALIVACGVVRRPGPAPSSIEPSERSATLPPPAVLPAPVAVPVNEPPIAAETAGAEEALVRQPPKSPKAQSMLGQSVPSTTMPRAAAVPVCSTLGKETQCFGTTTGGRS